VRAKVPKIETFEDYGCIGIASPSWARCHGKCFAVDVLELQADAPFDYEWRQDD